MTLPIVWIPGHLCGPWLYAPQLAVFGGERQNIIADTLQDDSLGAMAERLFAALIEEFRAAFGALRRQGGAAHAFTRAHARGKGVGCGRKKASRAAHQLELARRLAPPQWRRTRKE